jgi:16S rRNA (guanine1516-N2)-methyltransferase
VEVIYLDPMFPPRQKSAAVKKEMALLQLMLADADAGSQPAGLFDWAMSQNVARVVVKRGSRSQPLAGVKPSHTVDGRSVRFDVFVRRALNKH